MSRSLVTALDGPATDDDVTAVEALIENYVHGYWLQGALQGVTADEAYYVDCTISSPGLKCTVGVAVIRPAEFALIQLAIPYLIGSDHEVIFESGFEVN